MTSSNSVNNTAKEDCVIVINDDSRMGRLLPAVFALGLMVSPDNLALLGRFAGYAGIYVPFLLLAGIWVYLNYATRYQDLYDHFLGPAGEAMLINKALGPWLAFYPLVLRSVATILMATGLLVSSGFVFNEVFAYWFPNFGFAFILLGLISALHLLGPNTAAKAQILFAGIAVLGLAVLVVAGAFKGLPPSEAALLSGEQISLNWIFMPLLFFVGFDLAIPMANGSPTGWAKTIKLIKTAIVVAGVILVLWAVVSMLHVSGGKLAASGIAHIITARKILGQSGRIIMGIIIITGTCATLNALLTAVARMAVAMAERRMLPRLVLKSEVTVLFLAAAAGLMMGIGLAGDELLETYIRATLLLWLCWYGLFQFCLFKIEQKAASRMLKTLEHSTKIRGRAASAVMFFGAAVLALTGPRAMLIFKFMAAVIGSTLATGVIWTWTANQRQTNV